MSQNVVVTANLELEVNAKEAISDLQKEVLKLKKAFEQNPININVNASDKELKRLQKTLGELKTYIQNLPPVETLDPADQARLKSVLSTFISLTKEAENFRGTINKVANDSKKVAQNLGDTGTLTKTQKEMNKVLGVYEKLIDKKNKLEIKKATGGIATQKELTDLDKLNQKLAKMVDTLQQAKKNSGFSSGLDKSQIDSITRALTTLEGKAATTAVYIQKQFSQANNAIAKDFEEKIGNSVKRAIGKSQHATSDIRYTGSTSVNSNQDKVFVSSLSSLYGTKGNLTRKLNKLDPASEEAEFVRRQQQRIDMEINRIRTAQNSAKKLNFNATGTDTVGPYHETRQSVYDIRHKIGGFKNELLDHTKGSKDYEQLVNNFTPGAMQDLDKLKDYAKEIQKVIDEVEKGAKDASPEELKRLRTYFNTLKGEINSIEKDIKTISKSGVGGAGGGKPPVADRRSRIMELMESEMGVTLAERQSGRRRGLAHFFRGNNMFAGYNDNQLADLQMELTRLGGTDLSDSERAMHRQLTDAAKRRQNIGRVWGERGRNINGGFFSRIGGMLGGVGLIPEQFFGGQIGDYNSLFAHGGHFSGARVKNFMGKANAYTSNISAMLGSSIYGLGIAGAGTAFVKNSISRAGEAELQKLSLGGVINTYSAFKAARDINGNLNEPENLRLSLLQSENVYGQIRERAKKSVLTTAELFDYYNVGAPSLRGRGLKDENILEIVEKMALLGKVSGLKPLDVQQDIREIASGRIDSRNRIGKLLFGNEGGKQVKESFEKGPEGFMDLFTEKFSGFAAIMPMIEQKLAGSLNKLQDTWEQLSISFGEKIAPRIIPMLNSLSDALDKLDKDGGLDDLASKVGDSLKMLLEAAVDFSVNSNQVFAQVSNVFMGFVVFMGTKFLTGLVSAIGGTHAALGNVLLGIGAFVLQLDLMHQNLMKSIGGNLDKISDTANAKSMSDLSFTQQQNYGPHIARLALKNLYGNSINEGNQTFEIFGHKLTKDQIKSIVSDLDANRELFDESGNLTKSAGRGVHDLLGTRMMSLEGIMKAKKVDREEAKKILLGTYLNKGISPMGNSGLPWMDNINNEQFKEQMGALVLPEIVKMSLKNPSILSGVGGINKNLINEMTQQAFTMAKAKYDPKLSNRENYNKLTKEQKGKVTQYITDIANKKLLDYDSRNVYENSADTEKPKTARVSTKKLTTDLEVMLAQAQRDSAFADAQLQRTPDLAFKGGKFTKLDLALNKLGIDQNSALLQYRLDSFNAEGDPNAMKIAGIKFSQTIEALNNAFEQSIRAISENIRKQELQNRLLEDNIAIMRKEQGLKNTQFQLQYANPLTASGKSDIMSGLFNIYQQQLGIAGSALSSSNRQNDFNISSLLRNVAPFSNASLGTYDQMQQLTKGIMSQAGNTFSVTGGTISTSTKSAGETGQIVTDVLLKEMAKGITTPKGQASCAYFASQLIEQVSDLDVPGKYGIGSAKGLIDFVRSQGGGEVDMANASVGDLVYFEHPGAGVAKYNVGGKSVGYHVGVYAGNGMITDSSGGKTNLSRSIAGMEKQLGSAKFLSFGKKVMGSFEQTMIPIPVPGVGTVMVPGTPELALAFETLSKQQNYTKFAGSAQDAMQALVGGVTGFFDQGVTQAGGARGNAMSAFQALFGLSGSDLSLQQMLVGASNNIFSGNEQYNSKLGDIRQGLATSIQGVASSGLNPTAQFAAISGLVSSAKKAEEAAYKMFIELPQKMILYVQKYVEKTKILEALTDEGSSIRANQALGKSDYNYGNSKNSILDTFEFNSPLTEFSRSVSLQESDLANSGELALNQEYARLAAQDQASAKLNATFGYKLPTNRLDKFKASGGDKLFLNNYLNKGRKGILGFISNNYGSSRLAQAQQTGAVGAFNTALQNPYGLFNLSGLTNIATSATSPFLELLNDKNSLSIQQLINPAKYATNGLNSKQVKNAALSQLGWSLGGNLAGTFIGRALGGSEESVSTGVSIGSSLGAAGVFGSALGPAGIAVGAIAGGLLGGIFGRGNKPDPETERHRKKLEDVLGQIEKSLRPQNDYYKVVSKDIYLNSSSRFLSGRYNGGTGRA